MKRFLSAGSALWRFGFIASLVLVTALSLMPMPDGNMLFPHQDKVSHTVTYIYLFCLGWWGWFFNRNCWPLALLLLGYGIAIELLQSLTGYRSMEMFDLMANVAGIGLGWLLIKMIGHRLRPDR